MNEMSLRAEDPVPTRYSLLSRLHNWDDQESWKDFFDTYWRLIYGVAIKAGLSDAEAQDTVQETVLCVARDIEKFKRDRSCGSFKAWLRNLTRWRIADQLRKRKPLNAASAEALDSAGSLEELPDPASVDLDSIWEQEWQTNLFEAAVTRVKQRVKEEHYQMFDLYIFKHWPVTKVARVLGVNVAQVYLAKHRIASQIKKEIHALEKQYR